MSFQYIHTSAKRGLEPGRSGFCCVARDRDVPPDLIQELESQSRYSSTPDGYSPRVCRHRIVTLRSGTYHILTRIQESGTDYSKRNNHLAQHLAFSAEDVLVLPNPAAILLNWRGWRSKWEEPPRVLGREDHFDLAQLEHAPSNSNPNNRFPSVVYGENASSYVFEIQRQEETNLLAHLQFSINALPASQRWRHPFTNCLLPTDQPQDYAWSGQLASMPLPYEIDATSRPLSAAAPAAAPEAPPEPDEPSNTSPSEPTEEKDFFKRAPVVEIPAAYDRKKMKRPKRSLGPREISRTVNFAIAATALLCIGLVVLIYRFHEDEPTPPSTTDAAPEIALSPAAAKTQWKAFVAAGYPSSELARQSPPAAARPAFQFLQTLATGDYQESTSIPVPPALLLHTATETTLIPTPISYPELRQLALLPRPLIPLLAELTRPADAPAAQAFLEHLPIARYSPDATRAALKRYEAASAAALDGLPPTSRNSLVRYHETRASFTNESSFVPILELAALLGKTGADAYIAFDTDGLLDSSPAMRLSRYLPQIYLDAVAQSDDPVLQDLAFRAAHSQVKAARYLTAQEAAQAIYTALKLLPLAEAPDDHPWLRIRDAWADALIRSDLMEQTILGYTLEKLQNHKLELASERSQFSKSQYLLYQNHLATQALLKHLATATQATLPPGTEWFVIRRQSSKVPAILP